MRKPRPESKLKNLPEGTQAQIFEYLKKNSLRAAVAHLETLGIQTSRQALGRFYRWRVEEDQEQRLLKAAGEFVAKIRSEDPTITAAAMKEKLRQMFMLHAMAMAQTASYRVSDASKLWAKLCRRMSFE